MTNTHPCVSQDFALASPAIFSFIFFPANLLQNFRSKLATFQFASDGKSEWGEIQLHICLQFKWWEHLVSANFLLVLPQITQLFIYLLGICRTLVKRDKKREGFSKLGLSSSAESLFNRFIKQLEGNGKEMNETTYLQFFLATKFGN